MKLNEAIAKCCDVVLSEGQEFDADIILNCLYAKFGEEVADYSSGLARAALRTRVTNELKRRGGLDHLAGYTQLNLDGFEEAPMTVPFYDGQRVRYISTLAARESHLLGAIKLRVDNIAFCEARLKEYGRMLDLVRSVGAVTFGEALAVRYQGVAN